MDPDLAARYQRNLDLMASIAPDAAGLDYGVLERHRPFLETLDAVGNSAVSVFDVARLCHVYTSPRYRERLGIVPDDAEGPITDGLDPLMHPEDLRAALDTGYHFIRFVQALPAEALRNYKLIHDFRLRRTPSEWMRVVEQYVLLETDPHGTAWLTLSIVDVAPSQDLDLPFRARVVNVVTGEVSAVPFESDDERLTEREREVLGLVADGLPSRDIADALFLSVHTVNTHRQNILRKTGARNAAGAIRFARERGLI